MMMIERKDRFRPVPAEIRGYLEEAQNEHYKNGGQVRRAERLRWELRTDAVSSGVAWDRGRLGPAPGGAGS